MAVRLDHIWGIHWGYSSQYPQKTQRGLGVLHEDRSSNQRLRKLGPLEVVYKLQWRNLFGVFVPSGIWGFLAHCRVSRAAQSPGIKQVTAESCSMLSWNGNTWLGPCLCFPAGPKGCAQGGTQALLTWFICHARVSFLNFNDKWQTPQILHAKHAYIFQDLSRGQPVFQDVFKFCLPWT